MTLATQRSTMVPDCLHDKVPLVHLPVPLVAVLYVLQEGAVLLLPPEGTQVLVAAVVRGKT